MRQVILDTETTGLSPKQGHRIIEIGCVELVNRELTNRTYQEYINPQRSVDAGAMRVHGITDDFLTDKPLFADIVEKFLDFISDAELIIHNAAFDIGFINYELELLQHPRNAIDKHLNIVDTLSIARKLHPGQRNNLDALCSRYNINNKHRKHHGALLDSEILAEVYLAMTAGQISLNLDSEDKNSLSTDNNFIPGKVARKKDQLPVILASEEELAEHAKWLSNF